MKQDYLDDFKCFNFGGYFELITAENNILLGLKFVSNSYLSTFRCIFFNILK